MPEVHIWQTLAGVVALTPDAFGFSYCANAAEIDRLRMDLESGAPMPQAVGFSGSSCYLSELVRVESKQGSPTIVVVAREFLGKASENFTLRRQADREAFYETMLDLLGEDWRCEESSPRSCILILAPIVAALFGLSNILCGGFMLSVPAKGNPKPGAEPPSEGVTWILMGFGLVLLVAGVLGFFAVRWYAARTVWETIRKK